MKQSSNAAMRILSVLFSFFILSSIAIGFDLFLVQPSFAISRQERVEVTASVGELTLDVSGYVAPYASVVLTSGGVFLRSGVADSKGYFYISQVVIKKGFSGFCLDAIDIKSIGESAACFSFPPAQASIAMQDIFLPPTLGLYRSEIAAGGTAITFGYSMPNAKVVLHLSDGRILETVADSTGYYEFQVEKMKAGTYKLFADANFEGRQSLAPQKQTELRVLTFEEQTAASIGKLKDRVVDKVVSSGFGLLWLAIPLVILVIILLLKLLFPQVWDKILQFFPHVQLPLPNLLDKLCLVLPPPFKKRNLHHWWWVGY